MKKPLHLKSRSMPIQFKLSSLMIATLILTGCASGGKDRLVDLDKVQNAQPRLEAISTKANRPYIVNGKTYTPYTQLQEYKQRGLASWYGKKYHGKPTSSGEPFDMYAMTAAHPLLPIPSYAKVTNTATGRSIILRINDRGPFVDDRIIDLSYVAAYKLGILNRGLDHVEVESIIPTSTTPQQIADSMPNQIKPPVAIQAQNSYNVQVPVINGTNIVSDIPKGIATTGSVMRVAQNTTPPVVYPTGQYNPPLNPQQPLNAPSGYQRVSAGVPVQPMIQNQPYPQQPIQSNATVPVSSATGYNNQYGQPVTPQTTQQPQPQYIQPQPVAQPQYQQPQYPQQPQQVNNYPNYPQQPVAQPQYQQPQYPQQPQQPVAYPTNPNDIRFQPNVRPADVNQAYQGNPLNTPTGGITPPVQIQPVGQAPTLNNQNAYDPNAFNQPAQPQQPAGQTTPPATTNANNYPEPTNQGVFIQVGAYKIADRAEQAKEKFVQAYSQFANLAQIYHKDGWYKFQIGPFTNRQVAGQFALQLQPVFPDKPAIFSR